MTVHQWVADWSSSGWPVVANHLWQATLLAIVAVAAAALLKNAPARARYAVWLIASAVSPVAPAYAIPRAISTLAGEIRRFRFSGVSRPWTKLNPKSLNRAVRLPISAAPTEEIRRQPFNAKAAKPAPRIICCFRQSTFRGVQGKRVGVSACRRLQSGVNFVYTVSTRWTAVDIREVAG